MCGLAACFAYHPAAPPVDRAALARVAAALEPRGPDGKGAWHAADGRVALAHTRLAVIAPGAQGAQPMARGPCVISYNGEIYNHQRLRRELEARGHSFRGASDTEVLLALYREHGEGMLDRLRGMFAFALWDAEAGELLLARDAYGIKPLYYSDDGWTVRAASQVRALARDPALRLTPDPAGWAGYWLLGSVPEPFTVHRQVRAVPAGGLVRVGAAGPALPRRWFCLPAALRRAAATPPVADPQRTLRTALLDSVAAHFVSDVPVGVFLSAGRDSGAVLALAREQGQRPRALTVAFEEFAGDPRDEAAVAAACARHYGAPHTVRRVAAAELEAELPAVLAAMDQPSIDGVNTWFAARAAAEAGLKVALSGVGGDELLGGYPSFRQVPWLAGAMALPARVPLLKAASRRAAGPLVRAAGLHPKVAGLIALGGSYRGAWLLRRALFLPWELPGLMGADAAREGLERLAPMALLASLLDPDPGCARGRVMALEAGGYLRNQLLRDADWAGMAHGVEIRTPLVDRVLLESVAPMLARRGAPDGKALLARAPARPLPEAVTRRPRTGFNVPLEGWLRRRRDNAVPALPPHVAAVRQWARRVAQAA